MGYCAVRAKWVNSASRAAHGLAENCGSSADSPQDCVDSQCAMLKKRFGGRGILPCPPCFLIALFRFAGLRSKDLRKRPSQSETGLFLRGRDDVFRGLGHPELDNGLRLDLDGFAGLRVPSHACLPLCFD